jgi:hypothetical protein
MSNPWLWIIGLGIFHGLNPAMGWLFAVSKGLQEKSRAALFLAFVPIALGHALSIAAVLLPALWLRQMLDLHVFKWVAAVFIMGFGLTRLVRARHPRWVGMRVNAGDLMFWSFLMATAHGAGLMLVPVMLGTRCPCCGQFVCTLGTLTLRFPERSATFAAIGVHTLAHFTAGILMAWLVYDVIGWRILRSAWYNFDLIWAIALIVAGLFLFWS